MAAKYNKYKLTSAEYIVYSMLIAELLLLLIVKANISTQLLKNPRKISLNLGYLTFI